MNQWIYYVIWGLHVALVVWALVDLFRNPRFTGGMRWLLVMVIVCITIIGPLIYLVLRDAEPKGLPRR